MSLLAAVLPVALMVVAGSIGVVLLMRSRRLRVGGFNVFERRRLRREGTPARAKVLDSVICNLGGPRDDLSVDHRVVLEIERPDGTRPERVQLAIRWRSHTWGSMVAGTELPVLVSPSFPARAMIDYPALQRERRQATQGQRVADDERQRALLERQD